MKITSLCGHIHRWAGDVADHLGSGLAFRHRRSRIVRGSTIASRENMYLRAADALGASTLRLLVRHILPNILPRLSSCAPPIWRREELIPSKKESSPNNLKVGVKLKTVSNQLI